MNFEAGINRQDQKRKRSAMATISESAVGALVEGVVRELDKKNAEISAMRSSSESGRVELAATLETLDAVNRVWQRRLEEWKELYPTPEDMRQDLERHYNLEERLRADINALEAEIDRLRSHRGIPSDEPIQVEPGSVAAAILAYREKSTNTDPGDPGRKK